MSRVGNAPVVIPKGVEISVSGKTLKVKGSKGELLHEIHHVIGIDVEDGQAVRVGYRFEEGKKIRFSKKSNKAI